MNREEIITEWFNAWFDPKWQDFETIFTTDVYYSESWGPEYVGIKQVKSWFNSWFTHAKLLYWDVKQIDESNDKSFVEWTFKCSDQSGVSEFAGLSVITWRDDKIASLKEFASSLPKINPLEQRN